MACIVLVPVSDIAWLETRDEVARDAVQEGLTHDDGFWDDVAIFEDESLGNLDRCDNEM